MAATTSTWNHNTHYFPSILRKVGAHPRRNAIDVGSGDGMLADQLAARIPSVVGLDSDAAQVSSAALRYASTPGLRFERGDLLSAKLKDEPFDVVTCSATLHHMPMDAALERLKALTAPGGILLIVGLANNGTARDWFISGIGVPFASIGRLFRGEYDHGAPIAEPDVTYGEVRQAAHLILPGSRYRRHLYWRYSIEWNRPLED